MVGARQHPVPGVTAAERLGRLLQHYRDARGMTQQALADQVNLERSGLSQFETGARVPSPDVMDRWYGVFGVVPEVARWHAAALAERGQERRRRRSRTTRPGVAQPQPTPPGQTHHTSATLDGDRDDALVLTSATPEAEATDVRRDQFLALAGSTLAGVLTDWAPRPARINLAAVEQLELVTEQQRRLYHSLRSVELISAVLGQLRTVLPLLQGPQPAPVRRRLSAIACETAGHAAWLAHDLGDHVTAKRHYAIAAATGRDAGDPALRAYVRGFMSQARADEGDVREALGLVQSARALAKPSATATTRSWLAALEAQTMAALGDRTGCKMALNEAELAIGQARPEQDPGWQYRFDLTRYQVMAGIAHQRSGSPDTAERLLLDALAGLEGSLRRRVEVLVELARVQVHNNDVDAACWYTRQALDGARDAGSPSSLRQVVGLRSQLEPWSDAAAVIALDELLRTAL